MVDSNLTNFYYWYHRLIEDTFQKYKPQSAVNVSMQNGNETAIIYSIFITIPRFIQNYNTIILFLHLLVLFIIDLFSALHIIFITARQRAVVHRSRILKEHVFKQIQEYKQLFASPVILLVLAIPGLIAGTTHLFLYFFFLENFIQRHLKFYCSNLSPSTSSSINYFYFAKSIIESLHKKRRR